MVAIHLHDALPIYCGTFRNLMFILSLLITFTMTSFTASFKFVHVKMSKTIAQQKRNYGHYGPVDSNHSNLYNKLLTLLQGINRVLHANVNGMGAVVIEGNGVAIGAG